MNTDIRVKVMLPTSPKLKRLRRRHGSALVDALVMLWCWAGGQRSDGRLTGMSAEDIEAVVGWGADIEGQAGRLVPILVEEKFLDEVCDGVWALHDWEEHQPWAVGAEHRSRMARKAARARWDSVRSESDDESHAGLPGKPAPSAGTMRPAHAPTPTTSHPTPPDPTPTTSNAVDKPPRVDGGGGGEPTTTALVPSKGNGAALAGKSEAELVHLWWNRLAKSKGLSGSRRIGNRRRALNARLKDNDWDWRSALKRLHATIPDLTEVESGSALKHFCQGGGERGWRANFEWFLRQNTVDEILEGKYDHTDRKRRGPPTAKDTALAVHEKGSTWAAQEDHDA